MLRKLISTLSLLLVVICTQAQAPAIKATVDKNTLASGETFRLTISTENTRAAIQNPDIGGFLIVQGPFESSNFSYINGKMASVISRTYVLQAGNKGIYKIGPAKIEVKGQVYQSKAITIKVSGGKAKSTDRSAQKQAGSREIFATIYMNKKTAYVGEQVIATYTLYSRYPNVNFTKQEMPPLTGFFSEEVDLGNPGWEKDLKTINGVQYRYAVLRKKILFPQKSGELVLEPMKLECVVSTGGWFSRSANKIIYSNREKIKVKNLPSGKPADFKGAVGDLNMTALMDRTEVPTNEAVNLKLTFTGRCNLKLIPTPELNLPPDFEVYEPEVEDRIRVSGSGMSGSRTINYLIIPRHSGAFDLEDLSVSYYNTSSKKYKTLNSGDLRLNVIRGNGETEVEVRHAEKQHVEELDSDIRYIRTGDLQLEKKDDFLFGSAAYTAGMTLPALAFALLFVFKRRKDQRDGDVAGTRNRKANRSAKQRLAAAATALGSADSNTFYEALHQALLGYLADKFDLGTGQLNKELITQRSAAGGVSAEHSEQLNDLLGDLEMARYAPISNTPNQALLNKATSIIEHYEEKLT